MATKAEGTSSTQTPDDCYCSLWTTDPAFCKEKGYKPGYCGVCEVCGEPGHTRHYPGPVPYTGTWCDTHYGKLRRFQPLQLLVPFFVILCFLLVVGNVLRTHF